MPGTSQRHEEADWIYVRLYSGTVHNGLDRLIVSLGPELRRLPGLCSWFFIRFADTGGTHLRLRAQFATDGADTMERLCTETLRTLPRQRPFIYSPALRISMSEAALDPQPVIRIVRDTYVPETEMFGSGGMARAEALFHTSSEIALEVLLSEDRGVYSRKSLVLAFMEMARLAFVPELEPQEFWHQYAWCWYAQAVGDDPALWTGFDEKAQRLAAQGVLDTALQVPVAAEFLLARWHTVLAHYAEAYRADCTNDIPISRLAVRFAHLMNNRLGLYPLEDAYYGTLLRSVHAREAADA